MDSTLSSEPCSYKISSKIRCDEYVLWLEKLNNKYGFFVEINQLMNSGKRRRLLIQSEDNKQDWFSFVSLIFEYPGEAHRSTKSYKDALQQKKGLVVTTHPSSFDPSPQPSENKVDVVQRFHQKDDLPSIQNSLIAGISHRCSINPFQDNKALVHVYDHHIASKLYSNKDWFSIGKHRLKFYLLSTASFYQDIMTSSYGGWIELLQFPLPLWIEQIFRYIGDCCGVFIDTSNHTSRKLILTSAKIKICHNSIGFIPARIKLPSSLVGGDVSVETKGIFSLPDFWNF